MNLEVSGMMFQFLVLASAFVAAGMVYFTAFASRTLRPSAVFLPSSEGVPSSAQAPIRLEEPLEASPYQFVGEIETGEGLQEITSELEHRFDHVSTAWVRKSDIFGVLALGFFFVFLAFSNLFSPKTPEVVQVGVNGVLVNLLIFGILLVATTALVYRRIRPIDWLGLRWRKWLLIFAAPIGVVAMWVILIIMGNIGYFSWMEKMCDQASTQDAVKMLRDSKDNLAVILMAIAAVVMAPLVEEVIFRGYIYPCLKRSVGIVPAAIASGLVFAAGHGNAALTLPLFILAMILVLAYEYTGSIWMPITIHALFNGVTVGMQLLARYGVITIPEQ